MRALFVVALIAVAAFAETQGKFNFIPGKNLTDASGNFTYRWQYAAVHDLSSFSVPMVTIPKKCFVWTSGSVDAKLANASVLVDANGMASVSFPPTDSIVPMAALGYGKGQGVVTMSAEAFLRQELMGQGVAVLKGGMVGIAALSLQEMKPDGTAAKARKFIRGACDPQEVKEGSVSGMTCTMYQDTMKITVTYVTSTEAGILKYAATPVSPRSVDMIIDVDGFPLSDDNNHVRLDLALVVGEGEAEIEGNATIIEKDLENVYAALASHVVVNNQIVDANVTIDASGDLSAVDMASRFMLQYVVGANFTGKFAHVDFPAGAKKFIYDPAIGSGSNVYAAEPEVELEPDTPDTPVVPGTGASSTVALSLLAALVCALLHLF